LFQYDNNVKSKKQQKDNEKELSKAENDIFTVTRNTFIKEGGVFFGAYANKFYIRRMKSIKRQHIPSIPDFDVLFENPEKIAKKLISNLNNIGIKNIKVKKHDGIGEIIAPHYEIKVADETIAFLYEPLACHSYNVITFDKLKLRVATIDTMLSFYLAFVYIKRPYYNINRLLCMSEFLFQVQKENRLKQHGILKRFSMECYGKQLTLEKMRKHKKDKYKELKNKRNTKEYEWFFLNYSPIQEKTKTQTNKNKKTQTNKNKKTQTNKNKKTQKKKGGRRKSKKNKSSKKKNKRRKSKKNK